MILVEDFFRFGEGVVADTGAMPGELDDGFNPSPDV